MSLGKANYLLRKLIDQGLVKINSAVGDMNKGRYLYLLTPEGEEAKAQMTVPFINARVHEFEELRKRLLENLLVLHESGARRLLVVGSETLGKLLGQIARAEELELRVVATVSSGDDPRSYPQDEWDSLLVAEDSPTVEPILQLLSPKGEKVWHLR
jgi:DNA-binding PadR family transcriptional regulator